MRKILHAAGEPCLRESKTMAEMAGLKPRPTIRSASRG
jgi:hypothetical protein